MTKDVKEASIPTTPAVDGAGEAWRLDVEGGALPGLKGRKIQKGHAEELIAFSNAIRAGVAWPITPV